MQRILRTGLIATFLIYSACDNGKPSSVSATPTPPPPAKLTAPENFHQSYPLKEGAFSVIPNASLGPATPFLSEMDDLECHQLTVENKMLGWIFLARKSNTHLLIYQCEIYEGEPFQKSTQYGGRDSSAIYTAQKQESGWSLVKLPIENFTIFSTNALCNDKLAYWAHEGNRHYAAIFDLTHNAIRKQELSSEVELATDDEGYFPQPEWSHDCSSARFPAYRDINADMTLTAH